MKKLKNFFKSFMNKIKFLAVALFIFNLTSAPVNAAIDIPGTNYTIQFDSCNYGGEDYDFCDEITKKITFKNVYENPSVDETIKQIGVTFSSGNNYYEIADPSDGVFKYKNFVADTNIAKSEEFDLTVVSLASDSRLEECRLSGKTSCDWNIDANIQVKYCNLVGDCYWQGGSVISLKRTINIIDPVVVTPTPTPVEPTPTPTVTPTPVPTVVPTPTPNPNISPCFGRVDYFPRVSIDNPTATYIGGYVTVNGNPDEVGKYIEVYDKSNDLLVGCGITTDYNGKTLYKLITVFTQVDGNPAIKDNAELKILVNGEEYNTAYIQRDSKVWENPNEKVLFLGGSIQLVDLNKGVRVPTPTPTPTVTPTPVPTVVPTPTPTPTPVVDYDVRVNAFMGKNWSVNQTKNITFTVVNKSNKTLYNIPVKVVVNHEEQEIAAHTLGVKGVNGANCVNAEYGFNVLFCTIGKLGPNQRLVFRMPTKLYFTGNYNTVVSIELDDANIDNNQKTSKTLTVVNRSKLISVYVLNRTKSINVRYVLDYYLYNNPRNVVGMVELINTGTGKKYQTLVHADSKYKRTGKVVFKNLEKGEYKVNLYYYHQTEPTKLVDSRKVIVK